MHVRKPPAIVCGCGTITGVELDFERCYRLVTSRDARFDGWFFTAVTSTGIYCRPSCPAVTPRRSNVRFFSTAAAAQRGGFRACKRCRPDATPGSPEWNGRADLVGRAMRLIADGIVDREGVSGLAGRLGYTTRHVRRLLLAEVGAGPLGLARAQRAETARVLIETTTLPLSRVAFAAGFSSIRQFNDTIQAVYATTPKQLRQKSMRRDTGSGGSGPAGAHAGDAGPAARITLRLAHRLPGDLDASIRFLAARAVPGLEQVVDGTYRSGLRLPHGAAVVELTPAADHVRATLHLADLRDLQTAVRRCRTLLDLDADPVAVDEHLRRDPLLAPLVSRCPGLRIVGSADPAQTAVRVLLGQQVSVASARTTTARLVAAHGSALPWRDPGITSLFPPVEVLARADPQTLPGPGVRRRALQDLCALIAGSELALDGSIEPQRVRDVLLAVPGIGPWSADLIRLRALGDPDVGLLTDLTVSRALQRPPAAGQPRPPATPAARAERWRPWRSYAVQHLWVAEAAAAPPVVHTSTTSRTHALLATGA